MSDRLDRREFLKLSSYFLLSYGLPKILALPSSRIQKADVPNILIVVFDSFSATHVPLHGYPRNTTPNIARIAERATVYHNHFAGGTRTFPGTTSLLTGAYPWSHRGFNRGREIASPYLENNLFSLFPDHFRVAYTHNRYAENVLNKLGSTLDHYQLRESLYANKQSIIDKLFSKDSEVASLGLERTIMKSDTGYAGSLFFSPPYEIYQKRILDSYLKRFPKGPPRGPEEKIFLLEEAIDWIQIQTLELPRPYLAYFHLLPPHTNYAPHAEFVGTFNRDRFAPVKKPRHFMHNNETRAGLLKTRISYDEYILNVDAEFARLYEFMEEKGVLENTWVVLTSDHGEMFERGISRHNRPTFHQPIIRVPLLILEPGNHVRRDVYTPTVGVDVLPTLLHIMGREPPKLLEGTILPPFTNAPLTARPIFGVDAKDNMAFLPLDDATLMLVRWPYKMVYYQGYDELPDGKPVFELFDLENDPEELNNLYSTGSSLSSEMADELLQQLSEKDAPYS